jgi:hypothetical protein
MCRRRRAIGVRRAGPRRLHQRERRRRRRHRHLVPPLPLRDDLVAVAFADKMTGYTRAIEEARAEPNPWHGFCGYIQRVCPDAGQRPRLRRRTHHDLPHRESVRGGTRPVRPRAHRAARARQASGRLRADFAHQDVPLILTANAGVVTATRDRAPEAWRRLVAYLIPRRRGGATTSGATDTRRDLPSPHATHRASVARPGDHTSTRAPQRRVTTAPAVDKCRHVSSGPQPCPLVGETQPPREQNRQLLLSTGDCSG